MVELNEIIAFMEKRFPLDYAADYDNVGLLAGRREREISKVMLCLDCDKFVVDEAVREGAELIISHHPVIFGGLKSAADTNHDGEMIVKAIESGISIYCAHTNLDSAPDGLTDWLCRRLGLIPLETISGSDGRICVPDRELKLLELCARIKSALDLERIRTTAQVNRSVKRIAVCNGSGGSLAAAAEAKNADTFITGDVKYHRVREFYLSSKIDYIEVSHYDSEKIVTELLFDCLKSKFSSRLEAVISKENVNPLIEI